MSALDRTPENTYNYLSPLGFQFLVKKLPHVNFYLQEVNLPGLVTPATEHPTPFTTIPYHGEHIEYANLIVNFKVDEYMRNYIELYNWLRGLAFPDNFEEHRDLVLAGDASNTEDSSGRVNVSGEGLVSDVSLLITSNLKNARINVVFRDAFPISLGELRFNTTDTDVNHINCTAEFKYTLFDVETLAS